MNGRERTITALEGREPDRPPHFEAMFEIEQEAFGLRFPDPHAWANCTIHEKARMTADCMRIYEKILERFQWDALAVYYPWADPDGVREARRLFGKDILVGGIMSNTVWNIEAVQDWNAFAVDLYDNPDQVHETARAMEVAALDTIDKLTDAGAEFIFLANDIAFNGGPFVTPNQFREFVLPYLTTQIQRIRDRGAYVIAHTDGNIMPILDDYAGMGAHCYQSVDPMAGMDIAEVKRRLAGRMALMGNVQCSFVQTGPKEDILRSARYCLDHAAPGGGYIFSTSNTIFKGVPLENYEYMLSILQGV